MNRIGTTIALTAMLLTGCGGSGNKGAGVEARNATANAASASANAASASANAVQVTENVKGAVRFQPGEWSNNFQFTNFYAPGIKDQRIADSMRDVYQRQVTSLKNRCMTPAEAANPSANLFTDASDSGTCSYDRFSMQDGKIDATLACVRDDGRPGPAMIVEGRYTPTSFDMRTVTQMPNFASPRNPAIMVTAHIEARRIGPCPSGPPK